jgi:hypothetical protein
MVEVLFEVGIGFGDVFFPPPDFRIRCWGSKVSPSLSSLRPLLMAAQQSPVALLTAVIPPLPMARASVAAKSRFCRSSKNWKSGIDFSERMVIVLLSILK